MLNGICIGFSDATRGVVAGGENPSVIQDVMDYVTIATAGNAVDFGDMTCSNNNSSDGGCGSSTRGVFQHRTPTIMEHFFILNISTLGNAAEFIVTC